PLHSPLLHLRTAPAARGDRRRPRTSRRGDLGVAARGGVVIDGYTEPDWARVPLRRLALCRDDLREPVNATERALMQGDIPYWGANAIQDYVNRAKVTSPVVLLGEDGAPFYDREKPVAFYVDEPIWPNNHIHVLLPNIGTDGRWL